MAKESQNSLEQTTEPVAANCNEPLPRRSRRLRLGPQARQNEAARALRLAVEYWPLDRVKENPRNVRRHSARQITQLAASMGEFGHVVPVVVDDEGMLLAGHARLLAARQLGWTELPVIAVHHLNATQKRAFLLADNRLAELSSWDEEALSAELQDLETALESLDLDIGITGFDTPDLDARPSRAEVKEAAANAVPELQPGPAVTRRGDLWLLGEHRLLCGDAREPADYRRLLGEAPAQMVFADPPYNVPIGGHVSGLGQHRHREFAMASGEMSQPEFTAFLQTCLRAMADHSQDGAIHFICMDWRHLPELYAAGKAVYGEPRNLIAWVKSNGGMGTFYRSQHELIYAFKVGNAPHVNNFGLGERGRYRSNVWSYPGANAFKRDRDAELAMHPTVKPVRLVADAIKDCSRRNGVILDPFGGSGTTLIAAVQTHRRARLIEYDEAYCDVIVRRWQTLTGQTAHREDGTTFDAAIPAARDAA